MSKNSHAYSRGQFGKKLTLALAAISLAVITTTHNLKGNSMSKNTIVDIAVNNKDFSTLVTALKAAGLVDTLAGSGPFTVFAPTNEAFAKIDAATLKAVLADKKKLTEILTYHVVPGKVKSSDLSDGQSAKTVEGDDVNFTIKNGVVKVNDARVIKADIDASNGVIHVIDSVLMP